MILAFLPSVLRLPSGDDPCMLCWDLSSTQMRRHIFRGLSARDLHPFLSSIVYCDFILPLLFLLKSSTCISQGKQRENCQALPFTQVRMHTNTQMGNPDVHLITFNWPSIILLFRIILDQDQYTIYWAGPICTLVWPWPSICLARFHTGLQQMAALLHE